MLPQAMRDVVIDNGGRVDREIYFTEVHQLIHDNGGDTALESLRTSTVARGRLEAAGLTKVDIGSSKQIWLSELAEAATGATTGGSTAPATVDEVSTNYHIRNYYLTECFCRDYSPRYLGLSNRCSDANSDI